MQHIAATDAWGAARTLASMRERVMGVVRRTRVLSGARRAWAMLRADPADALRRLTRHPYYWLKHLPDRRRYRRQHAAVAAENAAFDRRWGTDTAASRALGSLAIPEGAWAHGVQYECIGERDFARAMAVVQDDLRAYTFVDIGAGKGKALLLAAQHPFARVIGVEFAPELVRVARTNVATYTNARDDLACRDVDIVCADALAYELPQAPLVLYLFNPFDAMVMRPFVERVQAWRERTNQRLWVLYVNPQCRFLFDALPWLERVRDERALVVYRASG